MLSQENKIENLMLGFKRKKKVLSKAVRFPNRFVERTQNPSSLASSFRRERET